MTRTKKQQGWRKWLKRGLLIVGAILAAYGFMAVLMYIFFLRRHYSDSFKPGVSFSTKYAEEMGVDWQSAYIALLEDVGVRRLRLMSYWDTIEYERDKYDFGDLDWQFREAEARGAKISLAVGYRQPRWPECHMPDWIKGQPKPERWKELYQFMGDVVDRYKASPALMHYQMENEALNTAFGICDDHSRQRLVEEYDLIKRHDPNHPVMISVSNEFGLPLGQPLGDIVGFSVYKRVYQPWGKFYFDYPLTASWHGARAAIIEFVLNRQTIIHELQTEPWGPGATRDLTIEEQTKSMDAVRLKKHVDYGKRTGIREMYLWGGEWWYWRLIKHNDPSLWNEAKVIFAGNQ
jgi:hypothetical protein